MDRRFTSFVLGGSGVAVVAVGVLGVLAGLGRTSVNQLSLIAGIVGAVGVIAAMGYDIDYRWMRLGAGAAGLLPLALEVVSSNPGLGDTQKAFVASAALVAVAGRWVIALVDRRLPPWLPVVGLVVLTAGLIMIVIGGGGLGHDESAYAIKARAWLEGTSQTGWTIHRALAPSVVAALTFLVTESDTVLRLVSVGFSVLTVLAVGWVGRSLHSTRVGVLAAALFAIGPSFLRRGATFLTDVPSTGLLLVTTALLWRWLTRADSPRWVLPLATVSAAVAVYQRYQSVLALVLLVAAACLLFWPRVRSRLGEVGAAAVLGLVLLLPHFVFATVETGVPWGIFTVTGDLAGREYLGQGLVDYARDFPRHLTGYLGGVAMVAGLFWVGYHLVKMVRNRSAGDDARAAFFVAIPAVGQFLVLGTVAHGEPRFMFYPVALLIVLGSIAFVEVGERLGTRQRQVAGFAVAAAVAAFFTVELAYVDRNAEARADGYQVLIDSAQAIRQETGGDCGIVTSYAPQLNWFSGCQILDLQDDRLVSPPGDDEEGWYLALFESGKRQPTGALLDDYLAITDGDPIRVEAESDSIGDAELWPLAP